MELTVQTLQRFFLLRLIESYNSKTIDSYRVRSNNAISLLIETSEVINNWLKHRIKVFDTVQYVIDECSSALNNAKCLEFNSVPKEILLNELTDYTKSIKKNSNQSDSSNATMRCLFFLNSIIQENQKKYLSNILRTLKTRLITDDDLSEDRIQPILQEIDYLTTEYACELIRKGYSKTYLFNYFSNLLKKMTKISFGKFKEHFDWMATKFTNAQPKEYSVIFVLYIPQKFHLLNGFIENIPEEIIRKIPKDKQKHFKTEGGNNYGNTIQYYMKNIKALDEVDAIKKIREEISEILDLNQCGLTSKSIHVPYNAYVGEICENGIVQKYSSRTPYLLDTGKRSDPFENTELSNAMQRIANNNIDQESKSRIKSALRHLRIGDGQVELEQQFINYWIGLEFLFSSPAVSDSTFVRMKNNLINMMSCCYIKRNIMNLVEWMAKDKCSMQVFETPKTIDEFISNVSNHPLKVYRLKKMKSHMYTPEKTKEYINNHRKNLECHLNRLYRLRNELVHEGALKSNIENVTSNLRYYLVFVLNQAISYCSSIPNTIAPQSMDTLFWEYDKIMQTLNLNKASNYTYKYLINVPWNNKYVI